MAAAADPRSKKEQKYDRQIRLWGLHGQELLEAANIALVGANAVGCETLKNLILPMVGSFTVVDGKTVEEADLGCNFFVDKDGIGKSRAEVTQKLLNELNPDVKGAFVGEDAAAILRDKPDFFKQFTFVIVAELPEESLLALGKLCWDSSIPLLVVRSVGMVGYCRVVARDHWVVEQHPDFTHFDLLLDNPLPEIRAEVDKLGYKSAADLEAIPSSERYRRVPFIYLLIVLTDEWKRNHDGKPPKTSAEKKEFKALLTKMSNKYSPFCENYTQANEKAHLAWGPLAIPGAFHDVMNDPRCTADTPPAGMNDFWVISRAVKGYMDNEGNGIPPVSGSVPDMEADFETYAQIQSMYRAAALAAVDSVKARVADILVALGRDRDSIPGDAVARYCKTARQAWCQTFRSLESEFDVSAADKEQFKAYDWDDTSENKDWYLTLRASERFFKEHGRYPGVFDAEFESDVPKLAAAVKAIIAEYGFERSVNQDVVHELCRFGNAELHGTAAYIGGMAAGEVTKLITHQFLPCNNFFIFNGIRGTGSRLTL